MRVGLVGIGPIGVLALARHTRHETRARLDHARPVAAEALERLSWIADSYLSVGTPVQLALPGLLAWGERAAGALRTRLRSNRAVLSEALSGLPEATVAPLAAGWSAAVRLPAVEPEEEIALRLLAGEDLVVHPGYFFDFPHEAFLVLSLLAPEAEFSEGTSRVLADLVL